MRSIDSVYGREAVAIAVISRWVEFHFDDRQIDFIASKIGVSGFPNFTSSILGRQILNDPCIYQQFSQYLSNNPELGIVYRQTVDDTEAYFVGITAVRFGNILKASKWWNLHLKEITEYKKHHKIIRKTIDS